PRWHGRLALLAHDLRLVTRQPVRIALAIASAVLPFLVASVVNRPIVAVVSWLVFGLLATGLAGSNLRRDRDFPELGRLFGISPLWMVVGRAVVPFGVALAWSALSLQLVGAARVGGGGLGWLAIGAAAAPALTIGAIRAARRTAIRHDMPMVDVVGTVLPTGPLRWASTGFDLAVPLLAPTLVAIGQGRPSATAVGFQVAFSVLGGAWYLRNQNR
ncbi:MAG: hypothetical protein J2P15_22920, partial [Micromonosporaceae bacterium]|nr:hypothetical protein [Micromonosporaceae bacterium]